VPEDWRAKGGWVHTFGVVDEEGRRSGRRRKKKRTRRCSRRGFPSSLSAGKVHEPAGYGYPSPVKFPVLDTESREIPP